MATIYPLEVRPDGSFALKADAFRWTVVLAAGGVLTPTALPYDTSTQKVAKYAMFSGTSDFLVDYTLKIGSDLAAAAPVNALDGSGQDLNPTVRSLDDISKISIYSPAGGTYTISFFL